MSVRRLFALLWFGLAWLAGAAWAQVAVPPFNGLVTDLTDTLTAAQRGALETRLRDLQARKGSQLAVLIVPTVQPETVDQYAVRVVEQWKLGRKGVDDGVLLLVAKDDRKLRIEVGYGLEGVVTDATSKRVIDEVLAPRFRQGDFAGGIDEAATRLIGLIDGEPLPPPAPAGTSDQSWGGLGDIESWAPVLLVGTLVVSVVLRSIFGRLGGGVLAGGLMGFVAWSASGLLVVAAVCAVIAFVVTLVGGLGRHGGWVGQGGGHYRGGGWGGGLGGGGGFGGGSGGGGFGGGGGGGSGGGGASGGW